jgi:hypothetical protein
MRRKLRPTGCTKFLLVMLILVPLAFTGASLYQGKNPVDALKELFGGEVTVKEDEFVSGSEDSIIEKPEVQKEDTNTNDLKEELLSKERVIDRLESRIKFLEGELDKCQEEIQKLNQ